jgi:RNA polymerase sigma factor (sigma-70 family)
LGADFTPTVVVAADDLDDLCRRQYPRVLGMLGLYCGDRDLAEELTQEALARLCRQWPKLPSAQDAERWLTRVAFNLAKSTFRSRAARRRVTEHYGRDMALSSRHDEPATALAVRAAVAELPERQRRVLILRYFCDLPVGEVALRMRCAEGTVKSLTAHAIAQLRLVGLEVTDD